MMSPSNYDVACGRSQAETRMVSPGYAALVLLLAACVFAPPAWAVNRPALSSHLPSMSKVLPAVGRLDAARQLRLAIGLPLRDSPGLADLLRQLYDPASPRYHQYLTCGEFTARFGASEADYLAVIAFARSEGLTVSATHPNRMLVEVTGSVADIERAFHTTLRLYQHPNEARTFYAPDVEPEMDLQVPVLAISGLDSYVLPRPASLRVNPPADGGDQPQPLIGSGPGGTFWGNDFRAAYAPGVTLNGAGQYVALLQFDGYYAADIALYTRRAKVPSVPLINVLLDGVTGSPGANNIEVALDIELVVAMAPGLSAVIVYEGELGNDILNRMATDNLAKQISASWTYGTDATTSQIFEQFAAQGQAYFNASGDNGAYSGPPSAPTDQPFVTCVGGTVLQMSGTGGAWQSETVWSLAGGGISTRYAIPAWQQGIDMTTNMGSSTMRNIPDVAAVAESIQCIYNNGTSTAVGGTSASAPLWAAFIAMVNQQAASLGQPSVGFVNPAIYAIGQGTNYPATFHDATVGNNTNSSSHNLFLATPGYDLCTGWGSPNGASLINALAPRQNAVVISNAGTTLAFEGCLPANGAIDPGETVTVNFSLKNLGAIPTTNLVATLQADSGVLFPTGSQAYGTLSGGGAAASRAFTFTANGSCGSNLTATLQLQDGPTDLGTLGFAFVLGKPTAVLTQNFDTVTAPALPAGWTSAISGAVSNWVTKFAVRDTPPNAAFAFETTNAGIAQLISPPISIATPSAKLTFRQNYNLEALTNAFDGGVLEIQIGASPFLDILAAGGSFISGGYNQTIRSDPPGDNPLDGREVWGGLSGGFITTTVNLPAAAAGQSVVFKWSLGTDNGNAFGGAGWYVDTIAVQEGYTCCNSAADLAVAQVPLFDPAVLGQPLTYTITVTNSGPEPAYSVVVTDTIPASVSFDSATANGSYSNGIVTWTLGTMANGAGSNVSLTVTPSTFDPITNIVTVSSVTSDPGPGNTSIIVTGVSTGAPPVITAQPLDARVIQGSNALLQVTASGAPPPTYQWSFNGSDIHGATVSTLNLTNVQANQAGSYLVVITNFAGSTTSSPALLTVLVPPEISGISFVSTNVLLSLNSLTGLTYTLEYKDSLPDPSWTPLAPGVAGSGGVIVLQDPGPFPSNRFYRITAQ